MKNYTDEQAFYGKKQTRRMNATRITIEFLLVILLGFGTYGIYSDIQDYENGGTMISMPYSAFFIYQWFGKWPLILLFIIAFSMSLILLIMDLKRIFKK